MFDTLGSVLSVVPTLSHTYHFDGLTLWAFTMAHQTHRAVVHTSPTTPLSVEHVPTPSPGPGSALVQILATPILGYMSEVLSGKRPYPMSLPLTPGTSAIGRGTYHLDP